MVRIAGLVVLAAAGLAVGVLAASGATSKPAVTRVTVTATEFRFTLSRRTIPTGAVVFTVVNRGKLAHDFKIAGRKTPLLKPGQSTTLRVTFARKGRYGYLCTVAGHAAAGMKGQLAVGMPAITTTAAPPVTATTTISGPATTVNVGMFEYRFDLSPTTIPAGKVTFVVTDDGSLVHNFDVVGVKAGAYLSPGQSETWTVGLAPGTYQIKCDVPFHADRGMAGTITVG